MEQEDEYIMEFNGKDYRFFTNGYLHREKGPALFLKEEADKYLNLGDEHLFTQVNMEGKPDPLNNFVRNMVSLTKEKVFYYLVDTQYEKEVFDSIILNHELQQELTNANLEPKKLKV